jgi:hypothetical protein
VIAIPINMLRALWRWVLRGPEVLFIEQRAPILRWWRFIIDSPLWQELWQELRTRQPAHVRYYLYGHLSPILLPDIARATDHLLSSADPDDQQMALTILTRWLASDDHATRRFATHMLATWLHARPADGTMTDDHLRPRLRALTILASDTEPPVHPDDWVGWATTLWNLMTDPTCSDRRHQMIAAALTPMMQDPMVAALVRARLRAHLSPHRILSEPVWDSLLATLIRTVCADEVVMMIEQALATVRATMGTDRDSIVRRFDRILAAGWGHGHDHRILQIIDSVPGWHWKTVLCEGITASVGEVVCDRLLSWFSRDQAFELLVNHIHAREQRGDWPLAPLPASLIPWVGKAARIHPDRLPANTIRRLWLTDRVRAWNVTQTMLDSDDPSVQQRAIAAMDAGWGTGMDDTIATTLRTIILQNSLSVLNTACATVVAGIGRAAPAIIESLLTELAMQGDWIAQQQLISALHRGWGRGQDALVMRIVEMIAEQESLEWGWVNARATLIQAWRYQPPHVVVSLVDRMVTHEMHRLMHEQGIPGALDDAIAAYAPDWDHLPTAHMIERIVYHVAHLCAHADDLTISRNKRESLISAGAWVIAASAERLSAADIHALLSPLWNLSPRSCLSGFVQWFRR